MDVLQCPTRVQSDNMSVTRADNFLATWIIIFIFEWFISGAIKKNIELRHHTDDETYLPLLRKWVVHAAWSYSLLGI